MSETNPYWPPKTLEDCSAAYRWSMEHDPEYARCANAVRRMVCEVTDRKSLTREDICGNHVRE